MGWIEPSDRMPPEGLEVLLEVSGYCKSNIAILADHSYYLGSWIHPTGDKEGHWLIDSEHPPIDPTVHAWMPLPKHFQPQEHFTQEPDLMEHAMFEDEPEWLYKGDAVYTEDGKPDYKGATDEITRYSIERKYQNQIELRECHGEPEMIFKSASEYFVKCKECGRRTKMYRHLYQAMQAWNKELHKEQGDIEGQMSIFNYLGSE